VSSRFRQTVRRFSASVPLPIAALGALLLFLFSVQLLGTATDAAAPQIERALRRFLVSDSSALGISWLASYALANGSVVAALALSLFNADVVTGGQLFVMIAGTRLGGSAIVVFVGALDYVQNERPSLQSSVSMGMLTFLLTHSIYVPVTALGYLALPLLSGPFIDVSRTLRGGARGLDVLDPVTGAITTELGASLSFALAVALLFGSLQLFDRVLDRVDPSTVRNRLFGYFERRSLSFGFGVILTVVTTSVAFSLGVVVPLYNRGYVEREELVPYVLGANIGTLADTIVVALVLDTPVGLGVVLLLVSLATLLTVVSLATFAPYNRTVTAVHDRLLTDRRAFAAFVLSLVAVPVALLLVPLVA
jgi:sodium-dependent phosphate cotransporter